MPRARPNIGSILTGFCAASSAVLKKKSDCGWCSTATGSTQSQMLLYKGKLKAYCRCVANNEYKEVNESWSVRDEKLEVH